MGISSDNRTKRRATGGKKKHFRKSRRFDMGRQPTNTRIGERKITLVRKRGGDYKMRAIRLDAGNFAWATEAIARKTRILGVSYNAVSNELVRTNTLVKNAIIQIDATPYRLWYEQHYGVPLAKAKKVETKETSGKTAKAGKAGKTEKIEKKVIAPKKVVLSARQQKDDLRKKKARETKLAKLKKDGKEPVPVDNKPKTDRKPKALKNGKERVYVTDSVKRQRTALKSRVAPIDPHLAEQFLQGRLYAAIASRPGQDGCADGYILEGKELEFYLKKMQKKKTK